MRPSRELMGRTRRVVAWVEVESRDLRMLRTVASGMTADEVIAEHGRGKVWVRRDWDERYVFWCPADRPATDDGFCVSPVYSKDRIPEDAECEECGIGLHELHAALEGTIRGAA
jgi:hypothetical protein